MGIIGIIWAVLIALKIAGVVHFGWTILILWPLIPAAILLVLSAVFGAGYLAFNWRKI